MTVFRQIAKFPAVLKDNTWMPDIPTQKGINWTLLEFDQANKVMVIEIFGTDNPQVAEKTTDAAVKAYAGKDKMDDHAKSPAILGQFWKNGTLLEEG